MSLHWKNHDRLLIALLVAGILHACLIFGLRFDLPKFKESDKSLAVVLVVNPSPKPPKKAEFLAPEPQKGGGEATKKSKPMALPTPLPKIAVKKIEPKLIPPPRRILEEEPANPPPKPTEVAEPVPEEKPAIEEKPVQAENPTVIEEKSVAEEAPVAIEEKVPVFENHPKPVLNQSKSDKKILAQGGKKAHVAAAPKPQPLSADLLSQQIAEVTAEFNRSRETQAKHQRMVYINSVNAHKYNAAAYESAWQEKVERLGNLNYPEQARKQNLAGSLLLAVGIKPDGSIYSMVVRQSSGEPVLDEAAQQIVRLAAPFAPFPKELEEEADVLVITRTWRFSIDNRIETGH